MIENLPQDYFVRYGKEAQMARRKEKTACV